MDDDIDVVGVVDGEDVVLNVLCVLLLVCLCKDYIKCIIVSEFIDVLLMFMYCELKFNFYICVDMR